MDYPEKYMLGSAGVHNGSIKPNPNLGPEIYNWT